MDEVAKQLSPLSRKIESIDRWKLSLWSNGSGGPPGYLEQARKEDDERYERLFSNIEDLGKHKSTVERFLILFEEREQQRKERIDRWKGIFWKIGAPIGAALLSVAGWLAHQSAPVIKILWDDYIRNHPQIMQQMKQVSQAPHPDYADDAAIPKVR